MGEPAAPTVSERWELGIEHDPRSIEIAEALAAIDWEQCSDSFGFKFGGDGDNGETLLFLLDVYFQRKDARPTPEERTEPHGITKET